MAMSKNFRLLWSGQVISDLGSSISTVSVPLIAVMLLKATPLQMGFLSAAASVPTLLLAIGAGVVADRFNKRKIMLLANGGQALLMIAVGLLLLTGRLHMAYLCGLIFLVCALAVFHSISSVAFIPTVVKREQLLQANTRIQGGRAVSSLLGKGSGGLLISLLSAPVALFVDAVSFLVCFVSIWAIKTETLSAQPIRRSSIKTDVRDGFRFAWRESRVRALLGYAATTNMFMSALLAIYVLYLSRDLHLAATPIGIIMAMMGVGALLGSIIAPKLGKRFTTGGVLTAVAIVTAVGAGLLAVPFQSAANAIAVQVAGMILFGAAAAIANINVNGMVQVIPPPQFLAKIFGIMQFAAAAAMPLGAVASGALGQYISLRVVIELIATGLLLASAWFIFTPVSRVISIESAAVPSATPAKPELPELVASRDASA